MPRIGFRFSKLEDNVAAIDDCAAEMPRETPVLLLLPLMRLVASRSPLTTSLRLCVLLGVSVALLYPPVADKALFNGKPNCDQRRLSGWFVPHAAVYPCGVMTRPGSGAYGVLGV